MDGDMDGGAEGDLKEDEISHAVTKPKGAGRTGGMDADEKGDGGIRWLETEAPPGL